MFVSSVAKEYKEDKQVSRMMVEKEEKLSRISENIEVIKIQLEILDGKKY